MEHIQLQTPWRRGDGKACGVAGYYFNRLLASGAVGMTYKDADYPLHSDTEYIGPVKLSTPEPMPELVAIPNSHNQPSCTQGDLITDDVHLWVCKWQNGYREVIEVQMADERMARLCFNAAARVMNEGR